MKSSNCMKYLLMAAVFAATAGSPSFVTRASALQPQAQAGARADADIQSDVTAALSSSPQLQGQSITAATIQGEVTLSGTVRDAAAKQLAEQLASGVSGVRSVSNHLTVNSAAAQQPASSQADEQTPPPPPYDQGVANPDQAEQQQQNYPSAQGNYPPPPQTNYPAEQQAPNYPQSSQYPQQQQPYYQQPSGPVTVPAGTLLNVRTSELLDTRKAQVGQMFQATVANDIFQGNVLAIPRGAVLTGQVTAVSKPGDLTGKAGVKLQLTSLNLGGQSYPLTTDAWTGQGPNKAGYSAANTAGLAGLGAVIGAIAGGGPGAAIGAVAGGVTGLGASAATKGPQVVIPPEAMLSFHLATPVTVTPVSYQEAQRLAASAPQEPRLMRRPAYAYPPYPYGYPVYYPYGYPYRYYGGYYVYPR